LKRLTTTLLPYDYLSHEFEVAEHALSQLRAGQGRTRDELLARLFDLTLGPGFPR
jgi:hypothetical protein